MGDGAVNGQHKSPIKTSIQVLGSQPHVPPLLRRRPAAAPFLAPPVLLQPKIGTSPQLSLFDTIFFFNNNNNNNKKRSCGIFFTLNKFLPVFNESHEASLPSVLCDGQRSVGLSLLCGAMLSPVPL